MTPHNGTTHLAPTTETISTTDAFALSEQYYQTLSSVLPGFVVRNAQKQIIEHSINAISHQQILALQAETGVGKTLGYLLSALPYVNNGKKRLVISTNTVALQNQLMDKDLPLLIKHLNPALKVTVAKGSQRYYCPKRALALLSKTEQSTQDPLDLNVDDDLENEQQKNHTHHQMALINTIYQDFNDETFDGDLDSCRYPNIDSVSSSINRHPERCEKKRLCPFGGKCPYYRVRS